MVNKGKVRFLRVLVAIISITVVFFILRSEIESRRLISLILVISCTFILLLFSKDHDIINLNFTDENAETNFVSMEFLTKIHNSKIAFIEELNKLKETEASPLSDQLVSILLTLEELESSYIEGDKEESETIEIVASPESMEILRLIVEKTKRDNVDLERLFGLTSDNLEMLEEFAGGIRTSMSHIYLLVQDVEQLQILKEFHKQIENFLEVAFDRVENEEMPKEDFTEMLEDISQEVITFLASASAVIEREGINQDESEEDNLVN